MKSPTMSRLKFSTAHTHHCSEAIKFCVIYLPLCLCIKHQLHRSNERKLNWKLVFFVLSFSSLSRICARHDDDDCWISICKLEKSFHIAAYWPPFFFARPCSNSTSTATLVLPPILFSPSSRRSRAHTPNCFPSSPISSNWVFNRVNKIFTKKSKM